MTHQSSPRQFFFWASACWVGGERRSIIFDHRHLRWYQLGNFCNAVASDEIPITCGLFLALENTFSWPFEICKQAQLQKDPVCNNHPYNAGHSTWWQSKNLEGGNCARHSRWKCVFSFFCSWLHSDKIHSECRPISICHSNNCTLILPVKCLLRH